MFSLVKIIVAQCIANDRQHQKGKFNRCLVKDTACVSVCSCRAESYNCDKFLIALELIAMSSQDARGVCLSLFKEENERKNL